MTTLYYIMMILALLVVLFIIFMMRVAFIARKKAAEEFYYSDYVVACAGNFEQDAPETVKAVSDVNNSFFDLSGKKIPIDNFYRFIVHGNSMSLCGISDGDLIMVNKKFKSESLEDRMPKIVVVKRRNAAEGEAAYKVRRAWLLTNVEEAKNEAIFSAIAKLPGFSELVNSPQSPGLQEMIADFVNTRLPRYLSDYPGAAASDSPFHEVIISTTLDTAADKIHFSIHPLSNVVGTVEHVFSLKDE